MQDSVTYIYYNNVTTVAVHYCMDTSEIGQGLGSYSSFLIALYQLLIMFILPLLLMTVCYSRVIKELWLSTKQITAMTCDYGGSSRTISSLTQTQTPSSVRSHLNALSLERNSESHQSGWSQGNMTTSSTLSTLSGRVLRTGVKQAKYTHTRSSDSAKQARKQVNSLLTLRTDCAHQITWRPCQLSCPLLSACRNNSNTFTLYGVIYGPVTIF